MTDKDTQSALYTALYNILTADVTLIAAMGGVVRIDPVWAPPDQTFPYLVHRFDLRANSSDEWVTRGGTYLLDIWSDSPNATEALDIRKRIIELLDEREFTTAEIAEITGGRLWYQADGFVPEATEGIWHLATQWNVRFIRKSEISGILNRT